MSNISEFVNAIFQLKTTGEYKLYSGHLKDGGVTEVSIICKRSEGYSQNFYEVKQLIARPNKQASIQKFSLPSIEFTYKLIQDAIKEKNNGFNNISGTSSTIITSKETDPSNNNDTFEQFNPSEYIEVVESITTNKKRIEPDTKNSTIKEIDFEAELEREAFGEYFGSGVKFANLPNNSDGQKSMGISNSVLKNLDSPF